MRILNKVDLPTLGKPTMPIERDIKSKIYNITLICLSEISLKSKYRINFLNKKGAQNGPLFIKIKYINNRHRLSSNPGELLFGFCQFFSRTKFGALLTLSFFSYQFLRRTVILIIFANFQIKA